MSERFRGYGWATRVVDDANDCKSFARAVESFLATDDPSGTLIVVKSVIGYGSPHKQGTSKIHSDPLGEEEVRLTKEAYGWPPDAQFLVPDGVGGVLAAAMRAHGGKLAADWRETLASWRRDHGDLATELDLIERRALPEGWDADIPEFPADAKGVASREASGETLNAIAQRVPWIIGGSASLSPSTKTRLEFDGAGDLEPGAPGGEHALRRACEHAMWRAGWPTAWPCAASAPTRARS